MHQDVHMLVLSDTRDVVIAIFEKFMSLLFLNCKFFASLVKVKKQQRCQSFVSTSLHW